MAAVAAVRGPLTSQSSEDLRGEEIAPASAYALEPIVAGDTPLYSRHYPCASFLVCRIMNLKELKFFLPASEQMIWLHELHLKIDTILRGNAAEKVDLSGDTLHFVSGTENGDERHADTLVSLAKELKALSSKIKLPNGEGFQVQMGLHSGECMTGVVGSHALKYSAFGAAVTVAKQLEAVSAPGLLRVSSETKRLLTGADSWSDGGSLTLTDWTKVDTFLLGNAADSLSPADLRSAHAACVQGSSGMGLLLTFKDQRLELPYVRLREGSFWRWDAVVCGICLALTLLSVASLVLQNRISFPTWMKQPSAGGPGDSMPLQLALGTTLAWAAAAGVIMLLPTEQRTQLREPMCMLLRAALSVDRVQSMYLALPGGLRLLSPLGAGLVGDLRVPAGYESVAHAIPIFLLSLLLMVRLQKHLLTVGACALLELGQTAWRASHQGGLPRQGLIQHFLVYGALVFLLPTAMMYTWERRHRVRYLASIR